MKYRVRIEKITEPDADQKYRGYEDVYAQEFEDIVVQNIVGFLNERPPMPPFSMLDKVGGMLARPMCTEHPPTSECDWCKRGNAGQVGGVAGCPTPSC